MKFYDLVVIFKDDSFLNIKYNSFLIINNLLINNGKILKIEFCGKKKFSYSIKKNFFGYYVIISFSFFSGFLDNFFLFLKKNLKILRFLIINLKKKDNFISTMSIEKLFKRKKIENKENLNFYEEFKK